MTMILIVLNSFLLLLLTFQIRFVTSQECTVDGTKCDTHERCAVWRTEGECISSRSYMLKYCPASCEADDIATNFREVMPHDEDDSICDDKHKFCNVWANNGECEENPYDMNRFCPKSCGVCLSDDVDERELDEDDEYDSCKDKQENCVLWADHGECEVNPNYMEINCAKSCNTCDKLQVKIDEERAFNMHLEERSMEFGLKQKTEGDNAKEIAILLQESIHYFDNPLTKQLPEDVLRNCENRHELCTFWAHIGECEKNPSYMTVNCAPACKTCNLIDIKNRCPPLVDAIPALHPGDLNKMFYRILRNAPGNRTLTDDEKKELEITKTPIYTVNVHSRPGTDMVDSTSVAMDKSLPPWVITFDSFLTEEECEALIQLGHEHVYKRSEDVGALKFDGSFESIQNDRRTSENAWCSDHDGCRGKDVPTRVHQRIAIALNIPAVNSEDMQLLKYESGQFYRVHHDFIEHQVDRQCGPRILTFFLYLNDVEEGGGTNFPQLDITIMPKRGRALLWPSILNSEPMSKDGRTVHEALDVKKGMKYASNAWIHMYDYMAPQKTGCT